MSHLFDFRQQLLTISLRHSSDLKLKLTNREESLKTERVLYFYIAFYVLTSEANCWIHYPTCAMSEATENIETKYTSSKQKSLASLRFPTRLG